MTAPRKGAPDEVGEPASPAQTKEPDAGARREAATFVEAGGGRSASPEGVGLYGLLVESLQDYAIFALDTTGHILSWNGGAWRIKGYEAKEIIGRHFSNFYPEEDVERGKPPWELEVAAREGRFEDEGWRIRKDGTHFWANVV